MAPIHNLAILDATLAHGSSRWLREHGRALHTPDGHHRADDGLLFLEFLHVLLLYDEILLDDGCGAESGADVAELFCLVNSSLGYDLLRRRCVSTTSALHAVIHRVCGVIEGIQRDSPAQRAAMLAAPVPPAYSSRQHHDYAQFHEIAKGTGLGSEFIPFALFCFRGLCYSGYANNLARIHNAPAAYLASHGRLSALRLILDQAEVRKFHYAKRAYADLLGILKLPDGGYDFTDVSSLYPPDFSALTVTVLPLPPAEALSYVLRLRMSAAGATLRRQWSEQLWNQSRAVAIGPGHAHRPVVAGPPDMIRASAVETPSAMAAIRRALERTLVTADDLDAFCIDYFPRVKQEFGAGMTRTAKLNLLLEREDPARILECLREAYPDAVASR